MPYIDNDLGRRDVLNHKTVENVGENLYNVGELVYVLYKICLSYWRYRGRFQDIAEIRGALSSTLHEFDRRVADLYENRKIEENGDVV